MKLLEKIWYYLSVLPTWSLLTLHNSWGIFNVFNIVWLRPMPGGQISSDHPFATGINPETGDFIWKDNLLYASPRSPEIKESDEEILVATGKHMRGMILKSTAMENAPNGVEDRMPPAINYIHGGVHYNGGFLIFNDFQDAISHFTDWEFRKSFWKFVLLEKREPVTLFRKRNYKREEFLEFVCFMRTYFPYFSNSNGNKKRIGWGNPAPYPAVNTITGHWKTDTYKFYNKERAKTAPRVAIAKKYFTEPFYKGLRNTTRWPERWLARFTDDRVQARGAKGNLFFVDLRKIVKGYRFNPANLPDIGDRLKEKLGFSETVN